MKRRFLFGLIILVVSVNFLIPAKKSHKLGLRYRKWLEKDVAYIITKAERKIFKMLETDLQRDMFINAFWKNRDPNHNTIINEYKNEHYKRLKYATDTFGRGTPTPGWKTEMGRIYITLGKPKSILRYEHETELRPIVIWYYQGLAKYGLPNAFNVVFFKPYNSGDYVLYSPIQNGPASLLMHYKGSTGDTKKSYNELVRIDPDVAKVSLNLIEGDINSFGKPTMASDILIQKRVVEAPTKRINTAYASKLLKYKEYIDVEYSTNYIPNSSKISVIRDDNGIFFVHYLIEPKKLSLERRDDKLYSTLEVIGSAINENKKVVYSFSKKVPVSIDVKKLSSIYNKLFNFQDMFPLIEGKYDINILIRNVVSKEFTSMEKRVVIPNPKTPIIMKPILSYEIKENNRNILKPFLINNKQMVMSPKNDFSQNDKLHVYCQIIGMNENDYNGSYVLISLKKDLVAIKKNKLEILNFPKNINVFHSFDLKGFKPSYYEIEVKLFSKGKIIAVETVPFIIPLNKIIKRAWNISLSNLKNDPYISNTIGNQYVNSENYLKGYKILRESYYKNPRNSIIAYDYCKILFLLGQHRKNISIGTKFLKTNQRYNFYQVMGYSLMALKDYEKAIEYFRKILDYTGTNIDILNSIGDAYLKLGKRDQALGIWKKSLAIMPKQKKIIEKINKLNGRNGNADKK